MFLVGWCDHLAGGDVADREAGTLESPVNGISWKFLQYYKSKLGNWDNTYLQSY